MICYLIEDSTGKIGKIQTIFKTLLTDEFTLKWVDVSGRAKDDKPLFNAEYMANDDFLNALENLDEAADSLFLIDLALNEAENNRVIELQERGGVFEANTAAKIIRKLQGVYPSVKIMLTTYITGLSINSAWKKTLLDLPEENPLKMDELNNVGFISSARFETTNPGSDISEIFKAYLP